MKNFYKVIQPFNKVKRACLFVTIFTCSLGGYTQDGQQEMILVVSEQLQDWLNKIPTGSESKYGFQNRDEFSSAELGSPFQVFTLSKEFFSEQTRQGKSYLIPTGDWRIPVVIGQEYRALVTVSRDNGNWVIVNLGGSVLARELQSFSEKPPFNTGEQVNMLRVYQAKSDFLFTGLPESNPEKLEVYPMHSAYLNFEKLGPEDGNPVRLSSLLPLIKEQPKSKH